LIISEDVKKMGGKKILLTLEVDDDLLIAILVNYGLFCPVLQNQRTNLICPPKLEDKIDLSSETGGQVLQFKKPKLCAMVKIQMTLEIRKIKGSLRVGRG
jgi:hypothetical protein